MTERTDVVELLKEQHTRIRELFDEVANTKGEDRKRHFHDLVRLLAVHETAEEEVVHPFARRNIDGGELVVKDRIEEEERAKQALSRLDDMDPDSPEFLSEFAALRQDVLAHADNEERYEFAHFARVADRGRLEALARAVRAAEALAPTRPHPGTDTALKNVAVGPMAAVIDRTRDVVRKAMG
ncbi:MULTISPECIES: hemerythrin domain-containing protein [unclassified Streptomyces]|uniref:hemerythrin domain-containing protein n=1 Tax=unclassified Streptomyces TaxID=2593676 RepID=UPI00114E5959|nr:hemerythrin domain-containing protein [Streptomyces sp. SLBN-31]TQJ91008.1 hemerythrin HHE cation binding domain-containing protein [Streptomyces sp. SLBN-31]